MMTNLSVNRCITGGFVGGFPSCRLDHGGGEPFHLVRLSIYERNFGEIEWTGTGCFHLIEHDLSIVRRLYKLVLEFANFEFRW